jgi:hypothetical protein
VVAPCGCWQSYRFRLDRFLATTPEIAAASRRPVTRLRQ